MKQQPTEPVDDDLAGLQKAPTGITGFDEITDGGLPRGRPTLVTGAAGSGKTMFGIEFLVRGARDFGEPGVLLAFEEAQDDLVTNVASLGFDLEQLERDGLLAIDAFRLDPAEIVETGLLRPRGAVHPAGRWPSSRSAPSASCSTRSSCCSARCPTRRSSAASSAACSAGSRSATSPS